MPIVKAEKTKKLVKVDKFSIDSSLLEEVKEYCKWASVDIGIFFEQAAEFILKKDLEWKKYKKSNKID